MEVQIKFVQIFSEIDSLNERLSVLGQEAKMVLGQMLNEGVKMDVVIPFLAKARKAEWANAFEGMEGNVTKERKRWRWKRWNRGYCREKEGCLFAHPREDCQDHLKGGCNNRGCTLRHRRACKFLSSEVGCVRGDMCAYLHLGPLQEKNKVENVAEVIDKTTAMESKEVQTEVESQLKTTILASKEVQAGFETETCVCKEPIAQNKVVIEEEKIICVFKRVKCSEEEWKDVEATVEESGMSLNEMLDDWSKVMEGYYRVEHR